MYYLGLITIVYDMLINNAYWIIPSTLLKEEKQFLAQNISKRLTNQIINIDFSSKQQRQYFNVIIMLTVISCI